jgi:DNA end-binding protein Ku
MVPRSSWKGYLRLSLVSVGVQAVNAAEQGDGDLRFHQLHAKCHSRIRYQKVCPVHGEVSNDEIVRGYEYAKGQYVIIDDDEVERLRSDSDRAIQIDTFVAPGAIDPVYFEGRTYYLLPDGSMSVKPYAVLLRALQQEKRWGIGQAVLFGREQLVLIRPLAHLLGLEVLHYESQVRPESLFDEQFPAAAATKEEVRLAAKLIEASTRPKFDLGHYHDEYANKVRALIDAKVAGQEIVAPPAEEEAPVINLMDALRKSVAQAGGEAKQRTGAARGKSVKRRRSSRRTA